MVASIGVEARVGIVRHHDQESRPGHVPSFAC